MSAGSSKKAPPIVAIVALCPGIKVKANAVSLFDVGVSKPAVRRREPLDIWQPLS
jgi:hypothetical protein